MKRMKKTISLAVVLMMVLALTACGRSKNDKNENDMAGAGTNNTTTGSTAGDNATNGGTNNGASDTAGIGGDSLTGGTDNVNDATAGDNTANGGMNDGANDDVNGNGTAQGNTADGDSLLDDAGDAVGNVVDNVADGVSDLTDDVLGDGSDTNQTDSANGNGTADARSSASPAK